MTATNGSTVRTGHGGSVVIRDPSSNTWYRLARITSWSINPTTTEAAWADSDSAGYTNRTGGRRDCTGSFGGKLDQDNEAYKAILFQNDTGDPNNNDIVSLLLWENANEADGVSNEAWYFPRALISNYSMTFDVDTKDPVDWTADFGADGIFYNPYNTMLDENGDGFMVGNLSSYSIGVPADAIG